MSSSNPRELIARGVIAVAAAIGAWLVFVEPMTRELHAIEREIMDAQTSRSAFSSISVERLTESLQDVRTRATEIGRQSRLATDSSHWYERMSQLTRRHGLTVQGMRPEEAIKLQQNDSVVASRLEILVDGRYGDVAAFVQELHQGDGFVRPTHIDINSITLDDRHIVHARISVEVLGFTLPETLLVEAAE